METTQQGVRRGTRGRAGRSFENHNLIDFDDGDEDEECDNDDGGQVQFESADDDD